VQGPDDLMARRNCYEPLASLGGHAWLAAKQECDVRLWHNHALYLQNFLKKKNYTEEAARLNIDGKLETAWEMYHAVKAPEYLTRLQGTIGLQPIYKLVIG